MPFVMEVPMDNLSPHGPPPGLEGNPMMPLEPHPPMSPPIPGPEVNSVIPMEPHPPLSPPVPGPGMFPPHPPLEGYPHPPMGPPMTGPEGSSITPFQPHPPLSPPFPGPEGNSAVIPMQPHPPMSPQPGLFHSPPEGYPLYPHLPMVPPMMGPEDNAIVPMGGPTYPQLPPPDMMNNHPSAPPYFVGGPPPPPPHALQPSFHNYPGVITEYPNPHNAASFPQQMPQHFGYLYPDHVVPNFRPQLGSNSCQTTCPSCHFVVQTKVQKESGTKTHLAALGMCLLLCWPFCLLPYFMDSCKNASHYCPRCGTFLGSYKK